MRWYVKLSNGFGVFVDGALDWQQAMEMSWLFIEDYNGYNGKMPEPVSAEKVNCNGAECEGASNVQ